MADVLQESETCTRPIQIHLEDAYHSLEEGRKKDCLLSLDEAEDRCRELISDIKYAKRAVRAVFKD